MDPTLRLRLATRIHFALLRRYGEKVAVADLLADVGDAQEALWVCEASDDPELRTLAARFVASRRPAAEAGPQDAAWARNTSGFGVVMASGLRDLGASRSGQPGDPAGAKL